MEVKCKRGTHLLILAVMLGLLWPMGQTPVLAQPASKAVHPAPTPFPDLPTDQIIIKYRPSSHALSSPAGDPQMQRLDNAAGIHFKYLRTMTGDSQVLKLPERLPLQQVRALTEKLQNLPEVEYVEPDHILQAALTPNDPQYSNQWDFWDTWGIDAPAAWDITTGSSSIVVADIDTGITNHADLRGRTVPGYDFIGDPLVANDGNGRDSDPSDPGDWVTYAEGHTPGGYFYGCPVSNSSWHGTHTAGTLGAAGNNAVGVVGVNWTSKILPVRVLGKCGGYESDIVDGIVWAAGFPVTGVPPNPNPARVINLSLGEQSACDFPFQGAIDEVTGAGAVVVAAAGNSGSDASQFSPANCSGVIAVAASDRTGSLAWYSNYGTTVKISAPGGDTSSGSSNGVLSTLNTGATVPQYDTYAYYQGTSMATPHVSGVVSLMLSLNPSLTPNQVLQILRSSAKPFPTSAFCNPSFCGAGIVDAGAAVRAVLGITGPTLSGDTGVGGVTLSYTDGVAKSTTSSPEGRYWLAVPKDWSGTIVPSKVCYIFAPPSRDYAHVDTDQPGQGFVPSSTSKFSDVLASHWACGWIKRIYTAGITSGCSSNPLDYCPEASITRAQMAVFLERGLNGPSFSPPADKGGTFTDVPTKYWAEAWIDKLSLDGITGGCSPTTFCPDQPVTRAQMAVLMLKAEHGSSYNPPSVGGGTGFGDVAVNYWAAAWIKQLIAEGISAGCSTGYYCPDSPVTRAQMAVFLVKTFHLP